ncbi:MAG: hypothetical protein A3F26_02790 [Candidatus Ryanbacteria bacterium RIFCSPHIGHO2_12_FULL_47_12b]|uniref:Glycosyltransferase 2-like domain-containing protein n=1 Tax=Candidatus Ryanbacteria bacterium RIFCSPLOWO2_02_FULL_47_14 TaxID=1802129 RepID=A0A1G2H061_9BACT|nr:MAG: hypothetical protein A2844_00780 [Candidatus Ryanbacteria bacterium RIFCSPHIGHO2_01_FULL_48_80]OGZ50277.1 MAG: hypothetical protein A3C83_02655 [Candidatus Ryanbacteria bacterium RIFCSPHIGHO2_02_FULL_47_25]OGZ51522.1 MAG: hypothetical protein A3A29_00585 [Candidatus Ryanbacteria bacterium RIFCSPLOWO2_01_FULL_47_79]OGZ53099.1 MAG: hypothetical protein A3F26_02790 [Candidatus Ryanbacteria bacterium RIFCSPHIGHO2_12_FULL_47_12b]OGZ55833.1 MAG: hypothetical protein A3J04_01420 [Candidatus Ry
MIVLITPTYNERANIEEFVRRVFSLGLKDFCMVIVDDNSPDGTGIRADELSRRYPIRVIHRAGPRGLGAAYSEAFQTVLSVYPEARFIIQMDADLSHDPGDIARLLEKAREYGLVLGSRYIPGGGVKNWGLARRIISRFGCFYSRVILGLPYHDLTGGFKCWRREALALVPFGSLSSIGYNFQIETTYWAHRGGARICEVPIVFYERKEGTSKFHAGIIIESLIKVVRLRLFGGK